MPKFRIDDLFEIRKVKGLSVSKYNRGDIPYLSNTINNNMIVNSVSADKNVISAGNCIAIDPISGHVTYQSKDFVGRGNQGPALCLLYNKNLNEKSALYICTLIKKITFGLASYSQLFNQKKLSETEIELPVIKQIRPDFDLLSKIWGQIDMTAIDTSTWKSFKLSDLFEIHPTRAYKLSNRDLLDSNGTTPVIANTSSNNGVAGYSNLEATERGNIITFSDTTTGTNTLFYQEKDFIGYSHIQGMYPKTDELKEVLNENIALYIISILKKSLGDDWTYANKMTRAKVLDLEIKLPVTEVEEPDWVYMERYIRAIEKLVIKDVVDFKNNQLQLMNQVVQQ